MDGAALLLLVSGVGVGFGWQPMPDRSQRYEYIIQVEPELAKTLADGQSIPIVSDIPDEVQPIGRIRLVVGRDELPRQRLVTQLKPASGDAADGGVALAQYNRYGEPQYGSAPGPQQSPPGGGQRAAAAANPYAPTQPAVQQEAENSWNNEQTDSSITPTAGAPPSGQQLFGQSPSSGNAWNSDAAAPFVADAASAGPLGRVGDGLQRAVAPLRNGIDKVDGQVRGAVDNLGDRTRGLVDELRQPFNPQPQLPVDNRSQAAGNAAAPGQAWNQDPAAATAQNPLRNNDAGQVGSAWNEGARAATQSGVPPFTSPAAEGRVGQSSPSAAATSAGLEWNNSPTADASRNGPANGAESSAAADPWANVPDPRPGAAASPAQGGIPSNVPGMATRPMPFGGVGTDSPAGPQFPALGSSPAQPATGAAPALTAADGTQLPTGTGPAAVGKRMLEQPADRPLDGMLASQVGAAPGPATLPANPSDQRLGPAIPGGATAQFPSTTRVATNPAIATATTAATQPAGRDNTVAVLAAWVLLTGSVAGNMYLFWSYLDVRQKYRALVRKTARAVGSRFSAA